MIIPAALNNSLQAGSTEVVASSVIISDIVGFDQSADVVQVEIEADTIVIEVPNG